MGFTCPPICTVNLAKLSRFCHRFNVDDAKKSWYNLLEKAENRFKQSNNKKPGVLVYSRLREVICLNPHNLIRIIPAKGV